MSKFKKLATLLLCITMLITVLASCEELLQGSWETQDEQEVYEPEDLEDSCEENDSGEDSLTTTPENSTTKPGSSTTKPESSTTKPESSTTKPESSTTKPESSTTKPESSTTKPESSTTKPESSTTKPENSTIETESSTTETESSTSNNGSTVTPDSTPNTENVKMVWIPSSGTKYHSKPTCSGMNSPTQVALEYAINEGYTACKRCH